MHVAFVDELTLLPSQLILVFWLGWVKFFPKPVILPVKIVICQKCYSWDDAMPVLAIALEYRKNELRPNREYISHSGDGVERQQSPMLSRNVLRAVLSAHANDGS